MRPKTELGNLENFLADADLGCFVGRTCFPISSDRQHIQVTFNVITSEYKKFPPSHRFFLWFNTFQNKTPLARPNVSVGLIAALALALANSTLLVCNDCAFGWMLLF